MKRALVAVTAAGVAVAILGAAPAAAEADGRSAKVVHGTPSATDGFPGHVALLRASEPDAAVGQFCGGTLIAPSWVLTAAHCLVDETEPPDVLVGTTNLDNSGTRIRADQGYLAASFGFPQDDIALVHLSSPAPVPHVSLALDGMELLEAAGTSAVVTGWGFADPYRSELYIELLEGELPVISDADCTAEFNRQGLALPDMTGIVCAGNGQLEGPAEVGACNGDSGGPLWATGPDGVRRQIGIVSGGGGPDCGFSPTLFTSVESYIPWIEQVLGTDLASFTDIPGSPHEQNIERVALAAFTGGLGDGRYGVGQAVTRGQMATFLARALGLAAVEGGPFTDVAESPHRQDINAVAAAGIAGGIGDGTYRPNAPVSRDQMATFLARAIGLAPIATGPFVDIAGNAHEQNINAVAGAAIAGGFGDGTYRPAESVTRAQMATFLARAFLAAF